MQSPIQNTARLLYSLSPKALGAVMGALVFVCTSAITCITIFSIINDSPLAGLLSLALTALFGLTVGSLWYVLHQHVHDISKLRKTEPAPKPAASAETREFGRRKSELLAIAAHELRNPLSAITNLSSTLLREKKLQGNASSRDLEFLDSINRLSCHLFDVVREILTNEGLRHEASLQDYSRFNVSKICESVIDFNIPMAQNKQIKFKLALQPDLVMNGDAAQVREAFDNYVSNAIKYSPPGKTIRVSLRKLSNTEYLKFSVWDEGPGLSEDDKKKAFRKFQRLSAKPTAGENSSGLGLSIVRTIVAQHAGQCGCESEPGQPTEFWIKLPL